MARCEKTYIQLEQHFFLLSPLLFCMWHSGQSAGAARANPDSHAQGAAHAHDWLHGYEPIITADRATYRDLGAVQSQLLVSRTYY